MKNLVTNRNILLVSLALVVATRLGGYCGVYPESCFASVFFDDIVFSVLEPLFNISLSVVMASFFLFFTRNEVFASWFKFAKWWLPLSLILIILSPTDGSSAFFPALFSKELTSMWMGGLFVVISLLLIGVKSLQLREKGSN